MTISDFLNLPNFSDLNLLAGENGLARELTNVTVVSFLRQYTGAESEQ